MRDSSPRARLRRRTLVKLAAFVTVTATLTVFLSLQIQRFDFSRGYPLTASFDDVSGLRAGDAVKIAGAPVGRVTSITVDQGKAIVGLRVHAGVRVPSDSQAVIRWRDALGRRVVYLVPGDATTMIRPGARVATTRSAVNTDDLVESLAPLTRSLDADQVNRLLVTLTETLEGNTGAVGDLIENVDVLLATVASRRKNIGKMIADYATVTELVASRDKQIGQAIDNLVALSDGFARNRALVDDTLVELARLARTSDAVLGQNADDLGRVLDRLAVITGGVRRNTATVSQILTDAGPKLEHVFAATEDGRFMKVAVPCITLVAPPCPYPVKLPGPTVNGAGRLDSAPSFQRLILGGAQP
ncbi:MCE family protein [Actinocorallia sp. API 0066]|uniref:MCE family protein n=1 Tax=Actinocorallia sp. API 0066 TaxID=2896846 RepID=UPI001E434303|nr:MCE family protein [Actinocorallia sp. API 0066]MCD0449361.1 MCE family protein [Actinocorallia sp. API 0066]